MINREEMLNNIHNDKLYILCFGQTPFQVFNKKHDMQNKCLSKNMLYHMEFRFNNQTTNYDNKKIELFTNEPFYICNKTFDNNTNVIYAFQTDSNEQIMLYQIEITKMKKVYNSSLSLITNNQTCSHIQSKQFIHDIKTKMFSKEYFIITLQSLIIMAWSVENCLLIYDTETSLFYFHTEDTVHSICKINEHKFMIGLRNGKVIEYEVIKQNIELIHTYVFKELRSIYAHNSSVNVIEYNKTHNIIITCGDDNCIHIRKYFDFELLSCFDVMKECVVHSIKVSIINCVYVLVCFPNENKKIFAYTLNGIQFAESKEGDYTNIEFDEAGHVIVGNNTKTKMQVLLLDGSCLEVVGKKENFKLNKEKVIWCNYDIIKQRLILCSTNHFIFYNKKFE
jgi:WD40 repeat protein